ncbi:hypothetical protein PA01_12635 [Azoarcus sp. PA01]|nr:hypothetical protein PA01_12635 [Azoarcus sp. PA01]
MSLTCSVPRLPIDSCEALFEKLKWEYMQLEKDWSSSYCTFNFVVTSYHLYQDWIKRAGTDEQKQRKAKLPEYGRLLFKVWRDITNATKHWELNERSQSQQVVNDVSGPQIGDWYAFLIAGPVIYVQVGDARPSLAELAQATIWCFKWLIDGEQSFALAILEQQLELVFRPLNSRPA